jgi:hypothetical protein
MRERLDHPAIDHAETAGAIRHRHAAEQANKRAQNTDAHGSTDGLFVFSFSEKSRTNHHVGVGGKQMVHEAVDFTGPMLAVAVNLDGDIVTMQGGVAITGLHRAADAEIEGQTDHRAIRGNLPERVIGGAVVDHQHIKIGQRAVQTMGEFADGLPFVEGRHDHQAAEVGAEIGMCGRTASHGQPG